MRLKLKQYYIEVLFALVFFSFISCRNSVITEKSLLKVRLEYDFCTRGNTFTACPLQNIRSIFPDFNAESSNIFWTFTLLDQNNAQAESFSFEPTQNLSFFIPIDEGKWKVKVQGIFSQTEKNLPEEPPSTDNTSSLPPGDFAILEGSSELFEIKDSYYYDLSIPVFFKNNSAYGKLKLKINTGNSPVTKVIITDSSNTFNHTFYKNENGIIEISLTELPASTYSCLFSFYSDSIYLFSLTQFININSNLTSNRWSNIFHSSENQAFLQTDKDTLYISQKDINHIKGNTFFVQGNDYETLAEESTTENNFEQTLESNQNAIEKTPDGSFFKPYRSVQQAIDLINLINDEEREYKILIKGNIQKAPHEVFSAENNFAFINISSEKNLTLEISSYFSEAFIDGNFSSSNFGRVLYLGGKVCLSLNNITIKGGYSEQEGGGIYLNCTKPESSEKCNLILNGYSKLCNNHSEDSGGGIFIEEGSALFDGENVLITQNTAINKGGGICLEGLANKEKRLLELNKCTLSHNTALKENGKNGVGGAIYTQFATLTISNCVISENQAVNGGAIGIAQNSNTYINNTRIINNTALYSSGKGGGAIFASGVSANLHLRKGTYICQNNSFAQDSKAGGINITSTNVFIYDNVFIRNNYFVSENSSLETSALEESNICFKPGKTVTIAEELSNTNISFFVIDYSSPLVVTKNYSRFNTTQPSLYFFTDNDNYYITDNENKEAVYMFRK